MEYTFLKTFDPNTGRYYFCCQETGETTWDLPHPSKSITLPPTHREKDKILNKCSNNCPRQKKELSKQRIDLIHSRQQKYRINAQKIEFAKELENAHYLDVLWGEACKRGADSGRVRLTWKRLDNIHQNLQDFRTTFKRPLTHLSLDGNDMKSLYLIATNFPHLEHLSMAANKLNYVCPSITSLRQLKYLNLLRNKIKSLPSNIGEMTQLEVLELANNQIDELPDSFGNLKKLKRINLECNRLQRLPETFATLTCEVLNLNFNSISTLPNCIIYMEHLRVLTVNNNRIKYLPSNIGDSMSLNVFHASNNLLMELPESVGRMTTLQKLWLDFNQITALPYSFYKLIFLEELKMDGNFNMAFPPLHKIFEGPREVIEWCRKRQACSLHVRRQNIIFSVQDVLRQVGKHEVIDWKGEPHSSFYEKNVSLHDDLWYQFPPDAFWSLFLPALERLWNDPETETKGSITSFPFERSEVERTLSGYQDASGNIVQFNHKACFRRCSCLDKDGNKKVCIPPRVGWMCERPAMLIKMNVTLERQMTEKTRKKNEMKNLEMALRSAKDMANIFLSYDEGKLMIRRMAEKRMIENVPKETSLQDYKRQAPTILGSIEENSKEFDYWIELLRNGIDASNELKKGKSSCSLPPSCNKSQDEEIVKEIEVQLGNQYVEIEISRRRKLVEEMNKKLKIVMKNWLGLNMEEVFLEWKSLVFDVKHQQKRDIDEKQSNETLEYENKIVQLHYAEVEVRKWVEHYDHFNDMKYWIHNETGEERSIEPIVENYLPPNWNSHLKKSSFVEHTNSSSNLLNDLDFTILDSAPSEQVTEVDDIENYAQNEDNGHKKRKDKEILEAATRLLARRRQQLASEITDDKENND